MEQGFHNGNHYKLYCLLGLVHLHWKKNKISSIRFANDCFKGCSRDSIATAIFLSQKMDCIGLNVQIV